MLPLLPFATIGNLALALGAGYRGPRGGATRGDAA